METFPINFLSFFLMAVLVEFGQKLTNEFENFNNQLNQSDWYRFSNEIQHMLLIVLPNAQNSLTIHGVMSCTRQSFKKVETYDVLNSKLKFKCLNHISL